MSFHYFFMNIGIFRLYSLIMYRGWRTSGSFLILISVLQGNVHHVWHVIINFLPSRLKQSSKLTCISQAPNINSTHLQAVMCPLELILFSMHYSHLPFSFWVHYFCACGPLWHSRILTLTIWNGMPSKVTSTCLWPVRPLYLMAILLVIWILLLQKS